MLLARAAVVYPVVTVVNRVTDPDVSVAYRHVLVRGGLHGSIPIALALGLNGALLPDAVPVERLRAMEFGVAAFSLVGQGLTMSNVLDRLGVLSRTETEELYELLVGLALAVDSALDAAEELYSGGNLPREVYEDFSAESKLEKDDIDAAVGELLAEHPDLRREHLLAWERRVLRREKRALMEQFGPMRSATTSAIGFSRK